MTAPDAAALERLLEHRVWVRGLVRSMVLDPAGADDVEQQVWLAAIEHGAEPIEKPRAWLATVARNWARRAHRGTSRRARREAAVARPEAVSPLDDPVERAETHREVVDAVLALPEPLRRTLLLHYFDGLSTPDVAARLEVPHETVRSRLRLARTRLKERLGPATPAAAWSPALLALAGLPRDFGSVVSGTAALTGGTIAMTAAQKLAFALVVPVAVGAAWMTASATASPPRAESDAVAALATRLDRVEKTLDAPRPTRTTDDRALLHRLDAIEARLAEPPRTAAAPAGEAPRVTPTADPPVAGGPAKPSAQANGDVAAARAEFAELAAALAAKTGSPEHLAALRRIVEWLVASAGPPADRERVAVAQDALDSEARRDRIVAEEAAVLVESFNGVATGNAARPGIAAIVAGGWAKDDRLADFLRRMPAGAEPAVHRQMLVLLDHHPSAAFGEYVLRLVKEERDASVLASVLKTDRVQAAVTAETAQQFAQIVDARMVDGSLGASLHGKAAAAIAAAGLAAPGPCAELLGRIAARESDAKIADACRAAAADLTAGTATAKSLEKSFR